jgi:hypothetical protein
MYATMTKPRNVSRSSSIPGRDSPRHVQVALMVLFVIAAAFSFCCCSVPLKLSSTLVPGGTGGSLGINLSGPCDWNSEVPFVDVFRLSRTWISQQNGAAWGAGPALDLDEHGWVKSLASDCAAEAFMCTIPGGHFPMGQYVCLYEGEGDVIILNASLVSKAPGRIVFMPTEGGSGFVLRINATTPSNYVRNIHVIMPGFESTYKSNPFNPTFLARWKDMKAMRFMDWMSTNNSTISDWSERPTLEDATWTVKGIPLEIMIDLSNRIGIDPWFCMPHLANDDYVANFAQMVARDLSPTLRAYVEYSNEIWNTCFSQTIYSGNQGVALGFSKDSYGAALYYSAYRSAQIFRIWQSAFGGTDRFIRVIASQGSNPWVSEQKLKFGDLYKECDALAVAPYFALCAGPDTTPSSTTVGGWSSSQLLNYLEQEAIPDAITDMTVSKAVADKYGVTLIAYEAGQHAVGIGGGENNDAMTALFKEVNRSTGMGRLYTKYLDAWRNIAGNGICMIFSSVGGWTKWGSWSLLEANDDDTPKYEAVMSWLAETSK